MGDATADLPRKSVSQHPKNSTFIIPCSLFLLALRLNIEQGTRILEQGTPATYSVHIFML